MSPRDLSKEIGRTQKLVEDLENEVHASERALVELEAQLAGLSPDADVLTLTRRHGELQEKIAGSMAAWEEQCTRLEQLRAQQSS